MTFLLLFLFAYYLPGRLVSETLPGKRRPEETFVLSVGLGMVLVNASTMLAVGLPGLFLPFFITREIVLIVSAAITLVTVVLLHRRKALGRIQWFPRPSTNQVALWILTAAATIFFLFHYRLDGFNDDSCVVRVVASTIADVSDTELLALNTGDEPANEAHDHWSGTRGTNPFLMDNQSQRLGIPVLMSPMIALFGTFGFRIVFALQGLLMPGLGFLLGLYVFRKRWPAFLTAVFMTFNPYSLESRLFDENFMAACFGMLALVLLIRPHPSLFWAGAALSLFLGIRHIGLLVLPVTVWYVAAKSLDRRHAIAMFIAGMAVLGLPYLVHHGFLLVERGGLFEGSLDRVALPYSFLGLDFWSKTMWNHPFVDEPLRSPYLAYPNIIEFPLDLLRRFGLVLAALVPPGLVWLFRKERATAWLMAGWFAPVLAAVMLKSDWVEPNKMGIPATVLAPVIVVLVAGVVYLVRGAPFVKRLALVLAGLAVPSVFLVAAVDHRAPVDRRVYEHPISWATTVLPNHVEPLLEDSPEYVDFDRNRYGFHWLPSLPLEEYGRQAIVGLRLLQLAADLSRPDLEDYTPPLTPFFTKLFSDLGRTVNPLSLAKAAQGGDFAFELFEPGTDRGPTGTVSLDLREPPGVADTPLDPSASPVDPLEFNDGSVYLVKGFERPWSELPLNLALGRDRFGTIHAVLIAGRPARTYIPPFLSVTEIDASRFPDNRVPLALPLGAPLLITEVRGFVPIRAYARLAMVEQDSLWVSPPQLLPL